MQGIYKMSRIAEEDDTLDSFEVEGLVSSPVSSSTSPYSKRRGRQSYNGVRSQSSPRDVAKGCILLPRNGDRPSAQAVLTLLFILQPSKSKHIFYQQAQN